MTPRLKQMTAGLVLAAAVGLASWGAHATTIATQPGPVPMNPAPIKLEGLGGTEAFFHTVTGNDGITCKITIATFGVSTVCDFAGTVPEKTTATP